MKKILERLLAIIIIIWIFINVFSAVNMSLFGIRLFRIGSGSMEPYLKVNDLILIKMQKDYKIDDIVTFKENNNYITHRIVKIDGDTITTKGDSNNTNDQSITKDMIIGKLVVRFRIFAFISYLLLKPITWILIFVDGVFLIIVMPVKKPKGKHTK